MSKTIKIKDWAFVGHYIEAFPLGLTNNIALQTHRNTCVSITKEDARKLGEHLIKLSQE